jgi:hypothetical protein
MNPKPDTKLEPKPPKRSGATDRLPNTLPNS